MTDDEWTEVYQGLETDALRKILARAKDNPASQAGLIKHLLTEQEERKQRIRVITSLLSDKEP